MDTNSSSSRPTLIQFPKSTPSAPRRSRLAVASFALGLLTGAIWSFEICLLLCNYIFEIGILLTLLTTPLGLLLGLGALWQIRRSNGTVGGRNLAVMGISIALLVAVLLVLPLFARTHCG